MKPAAKGRQLSCTHGAAFSQSLFLELHALSTTHLTLDMKDEVTRTLILLLILTCRFNNLLVNFMSSVFMLLK